MPYVDPYYDPWFPNSDWRALVTSLEANWRVGYGETTSSGNLTAWADQVNGHSMALVTGTVAPGVFGWTFDGAATLMRCTSALAGTVDDAAPWTFIALATVEGGVADQMIVGGYNSGVAANWRRLWADGGVVAASNREGGTNNSVQGGTSLTADAAVYAATWASSLSVYLDGASDATPVAAAATPTLDRISLGALDNGSPANYLDGQIAEILVCSAELSASEIAFISASLISEYGL